MQTLTDQEKANRKRIYAQEYSRKHNYMDNPGDTKMPEYSAEEIQDIESGMLLKDVAKKYGRSFDGVSDKKYRMSAAYKSPKQKAKEKYQETLRLKAEGKWDFSNNCPKPGVRITKIKVTKKEAEELDPQIDNLLNGDLSIEEFLNS